MKRREREGEKRRSKEGVGQGKGQGKRKDRGKYRWWRDEGIGIRGKEGTLLPSDKLAAGRWSEKWYCAHPVSIRGSVADGFSSAKSIGSKKHSNCPVLSWQSCLGWRYLVAPPWLSFLYIFFFSFIRLLNFLIYYITFTRHLYYHIYDFRTTV